MRIIVAPNPFKGTLTSDEAATIMENAIHSVDPSIETFYLPMADGGEGTVSSLCKAWNGTLKTVVVSGPLGEPISAKYAVFPDGTVVVEMAQAAGLGIIKPNLSPMKASTYGVGEIISYVLENENPQRILIGLGGSCTTDGGCGMIAALGGTFWNCEGHEFIPSGGTLKDISCIDVEKVKLRLEGVKIIGMCDVKAPLYGESGAAYVYGPQKGATQQNVLELDKGLQNLAFAGMKETGVDNSFMPGAGAAGGTGYAITEFMNGTLMSGAETILSAMDFDEMLKGTDYVFTGEGRIDFQTLQGKGVYELIRRAHNKGVESVVICGDIKTGYEKLYGMGLAAVFTINRIAMERSLSKLDTPMNLFSTTADVVRLLMCASKKKK